MAETERECVLRTVNELWTERSSFDSQIREIAMFMRPRRSRFYVDDVNKGTKRFQHILNTRATKDLQIAQSGLLSGVMSPSKAWFGLGTPDTSLMASQAVQQYMADVARLLRTIFSRSNLYKMAPTMLGELILFGTGCMMQVEDFRDVTRFYTLTFGSYAIAQNDRQEVNTLGRKFTMTAMQMVGKFGYDNVGKIVQSAYDKSNYTQKFEVYHLVCPNPDADARKLSSAFLPFKSTYINVADNTKGEPLEVKGFHSFPFHTPRWETTGEDTYGTDCPGMTALGAVKGLQIQERRKGQGIDKMINPPLHGPASLKNVPLQNVPGGATLYDDGGQGNNGLRPVYQVNLPITELTQDMARQERMIDEIFLRDLFDSMNSMEGVQPQNQLYLNLKNNEKLLQVGPVLESLHGEFLDGLIDRTFDMAARAGILPQPPAELQGHTIKPRYISPLAMAQLAAATGDIERLTYFVGGLKAVIPDVTDKLNGDKLVDEYAAALATEPDLLVTDDQVAAIRTARAQQAQQAQQLAAAQSGATTAKTLADAKTSDPSALTAITQAATGAGSPANPGLVPLAQQLNQGTVPR